MSRARRTTGNQRSSAVVKLTLPKAETAAKGEGQTPATSGSQTAGTKAAHSSKRKAAATA